MPTTRVLISIDPVTLRAIDEACRARGLTRSRYLAQLAEDDLRLPIGPGASEGARRALRTIDGLFER